MGPWGGQRTPPTPHLGGHPFLDGWTHPPAPAAPSPSQASCPAYKQRLPMTFFLFVLESKLSRNKRWEPRALPGLTFTLILFSLPTASLFLPGA